MSLIEVEPTGVVFHPDNKRVLVRPFISSDEERVRHAIGRALSLTEAEVEAQLVILRADFNSSRTFVRGCRNSSSAACRKLRSSSIGSLSSALFTGTMRCGAPYSVSPATA